MTKALLIGLGAAVGANARYFIGVWASSRFPSDFPWGTLMVNLLGSFLIGLIVATSVARGWGEDWGVFLTVGLLGGFTTFSAFSHENLAMMQKGRMDLLLFNALGSVLLGLGVAWLGFWIAQKAL